MRIPLDYYQILGVPIQATADEIERAYQDRIQQQPRQAYSATALEARQQLLAVARDILCDPERRAEYDAHFLSPPPERESAPIQLPQTERPSWQSHGSEDAATPWIEVRDDRVVGALLILQELGECERARGIAESRFRDRYYPSTEAAGWETASERGDLVRVLAVAYLESSRESWRQGQYERAARLGQQGWDLLTREGLFGDLKQAIAADLAKLRPYRILEAVSQSGEGSWRKHQGLQLLREMLEARGGIEGSDRDGSGLDADAFLLFVQQLRPYLTAAQQQTLFDAEAQRPSATAAYLAARAQIARGFAYRQLGAIAGAQTLLARWEREQEVGLEQAVCALLLGQTDRAHQAAERIADPDVAREIRRNSVGAPDWLPGLCAYSESWLRTQVFPHFQDLAQQAASLKDYFADERVQWELEQQQFSDERPYGPVEAQFWAGGAQAGSAHTEPDRAVPSATATAVATEPVPASAGSSHERAAPATGPPGDSRQLHPSQQRLRFRRGRLLLLAGLGVAGIATASYATVRAFQNLGDRSASSPTAPAGEALVLRLDRPTVEVPPASPSLQASQARQAIRDWLQAKAQAMGPEHQIGQLEQVLSDPMLSKRQASARALQRRDRYQRFEHAIESVSVSERSEESAQVEATVRERAQTYRQGAPSPESSYDSTLALRYSLVRQDGRWQIAAVERRDGNP